MIGKKSESLKERRATIDAHVGERVRQARILKGLSREQLATEIGVSVPQLQKYEAGVTRISARTLYELTRILDQDVSFFFSGMEQSIRDGTLPKPI